MTEEQAEYKIEVDDAMEMLGKGYRPVVQFEPPSEQIIETEDGFAIAQSLGWVKFSAYFRERMLAKLKGAKLSVFMCICLHVNENGEAFPSIDTIADETDLHRDTVMDTISELENIPGLLDVIRRVGKKNIYRPAFAARGNKKEPSIPVDVLPTGRKNNKTSRIPVDETSTTPVDVSSTLSRESKKNNENSVSSKSIIDRESAKKRKAEQRARKTDPLGNWLHLQDPEKIAEQEATNDLWDRLESALSISVTTNQRDREDWKNVIAYLLANEKQGKTIERYAEWAKDHPYDAPTKKQMANQPWMIQNTFPAAFESKIDSESEADQEWKNQDWRNVELS